MELLKGAIARGHLLRRAGFGYTPELATSLANVPYDELVDQLVADLTAPAPKDPPGFSTYQPGAIQQLWLERMVASPLGAGEKLALFWHGHFATSNAKIKDASLMWTQYQLFRSKGAGSFEELVKGISRDVAMIRWLDGNANRKGTANENYGRELQELFTLGIGNYSDIGGPDFPLVWDLEPDFYLPGFDRSFEIVVKDDDATTSDDEIEFTESFTFDSGDARLNEDTNLVVRSPSGETTIRIRYRIVD